MPTEELLMRHEALGLRHFCNDDLEALFDLESDPFLKQFVGGPVTKSRAQWLQDAARLPLHSYQFALVCAASNAFAGRVTLGHFQQADCREAQVILARQFVGKGLGRTALCLACAYAFEIFGAKSVVGIVDPQHAASIALVEALGFHEASPVLAEGGSIIKRVFELARVGA
ncbi:MAG: GNAT family N-acetyltransferase [Rudaea sp.]